MTCRQQGNGRGNAHHCLANKSEDKQEGNGLRPEVHHVDLIMGKHRIEESGKGGNQARPQGIGKESKLHDDPVEGGVGRGPDRHLPALIEAGGKSGADLLQGLQIEYK